MGSSSSANGSERGGDNARRNSPICALMKRLALFGLLACLKISTPSIYGQEPAAFEKIRDISPDKKFAMRITCRGQPDDPDNIETDLISAVDIVSLPAKEVVGTLATEIIYGGFYLRWSSDSHWCAFYSSTGPRVGETNIYKLQGDKFVPLKTEEFGVAVKGDVRNQYTKPQIL